MMWRVMAKRTCGNDKVLGFDVLNEPYTGQAHMTEDFDIEYLMPFYEKAMAISMGFVMTGCIFSSLPPCAC